MQKILIAVLAIALLAVSGTWGYMTWKGKQPVVAAAAPSPATTPTPPAAPATSPAQARSPDVTTAPPPGEDAPGDTQADAADPDAAEPAEPTSTVEPPRGGVNFTYEYVPPRDPALRGAYEFSVQTDLLHRLPEVNSMDGLLMLPGPLHLVAAECKQTNAFYSSDKHELVLCYEMVEMLVKLGTDLGAQSQDESYSARFLLANTRFIMLHEFGHALIDMLSLAATGREEDSADQLASSLMMMFTDPNESPSALAQNLRLAGLFFMLNSKDQYGAADFADEHSLGEQRFYNLMCMLYGHDPAKYLRLVTSGMLPEDRAQRCPTESQRITQSWAKLLVPHIAPKFQVSGEEAQRRYEEAQRQQRENAASPYVR